MPKTKAKPSTAPSRSTGRISKAPTRFRPSSDAPTELLELIHSAATAAAAESTVPFESDAIIALEEALEPVLEAMCAAALKVATKAGRESISEADLKQVSKDYMKKSKA